MTAEKQRLHCVRWFTAFFITGLVLSGATAIPLEGELDWLVNVTGARQLVEASASGSEPARAAWSVRVQAARGDDSLSYISW